ncbi:MAG: RNA polymerase sigma-70 factor [Micavibrio sp.]|nr:RNA polymerase sigma-70 factor [Micavibrio sp.]|tara:strand:+ start:272 stop:850 length:579 start_codon:yes stop_codon:yes gene_type:complete
MTIITDTTTDTGILDDDVLLERIKRDDQAAFSMLMERYRDKIKGLAWRLLYNDEAAEDALQEVFCAVWQNKDKWEIGGAAKFSTWIYRVTVNKCVDVKRKMRPQVDIDDTNLSTNARAERIISAKQMEKTLGQLLDTLPEQQALALRMYYYEDKKVEDIAAELDNTELGVRSLIKRGKAALRLYESDLEIYR